MTHGEGFKCSTYKGISCFIWLVGIGVTGAYLDLSLNKKPTNDALKYSAIALGTSSLICCLMTICWGALPLCFRRCINTLNDKYDPFRRSADNKYDPLNCLIDNNY